MKLAEIKVGIAYAYSTKRDPSGFDEVIVLDTRLFTLDSRFRRDCLRLTASTRTTRFGDPKVCTGVLVAERGPLLSEGERVGRDAVLAAGKALVGQVEAIEFGAFNLPSRELATGWQLQVVLPRHLRGEYNAVLIEQDHREEEERRRFEEAERRRVQAADHVDALVLRAREAGFSVYSAHSYGATYVIRMDVEVFEKILARLEGERL